MDDRYLWDRSGPPDPEIERLERLLGRFRQNRPTPRAPRRSPKALLFLALAALLALGVGAVWIAARPGAAWGVDRLAGAPLVGSERIGETGRLAVGEWLETDSASRAKLQVGRIGQVEIEPNSRLRLVAARFRDHRLALERGTIEARIWAPPRLFFVETPSALAVDLGCVYTLTVDESGGGLLSVTAGWVELDREGRESLVPAGASCATKVGIGPGTPFYDDASPAFREALRRFDFEEDGDAALDALLAETRKRDALTLWHLLLRTEREQQTRVFRRLAALVPPPPGVTEEGIRRRDDKMLEAWRGQLGLRWFRKDAPWWQSAWRSLWS
jgi:FecR protein